MKFFLCLILIGQIGFVSCSSGKTKMSIDDGQALYEKYCLSCHNYNQNTEYHPSLYEMIKMNKAFENVVTDSFHRTAVSFKREAEKDTLMVFLKNYDGISY